MTMLTDWDYRQVKDFDYLVQLFKEQETKYITDESLRLGHIIREKLQITIADLDDENSKFFKGNYNPITPRTLQEPWMYKTQIDAPPELEIINDLDVIFLSNGEPNAEENFQQLLKVCPRAKQVTGIKGIYQAHREASQTSGTDFFFIVDADAWVIDDFEFTIRSFEIAENMVCVWQSLNPVNNLVYGYGGVKLFCKQMFIKDHSNLVDMTTTIAKYIKVMPEISCVTKFNTSKYDAWRSGFRECAKLASKSIAGQVDTETEQRLQAWLTRGEDSAFGKWTIAGARAGQKFGLENAGTDRMQLINDYNFLKEQFNNDN
jgi:hypothetical protein